MITQFLHATLRIFTFSSISSNTRTTSYDLFRNNLFFLLVNKILVQPNYSIREIFSFLDYDVFFSL